MLQLNRASDVCTGKLTLKLVHARRRLFSERLAKANLAAIPDALPRKPTVNFP